MFRGMFGRIKEIFLRTVREFTKNVFHTGGLRVTMCNECFFTELGETLNDSWAEASFEIGDFEIATQEGVDRVAHFIFGGIAGAERAALGMSEH
jgi:hypothetical protein